MKGLLLSWAANAIMLAVAAVILVSMLMIEITQSIVSGFAVHGFWTLVWATLIVWVVNVILDSAPGPWRDTRR